MKEFIFRAKVTYRGADVIVLAETIEEARKKADLGEWESDGIGGAEMVDYEILDGGKENT